MKRREFYMLTGLVARKASIWTHEGLCESTDKMDDEISPDAPTRFADEIEQVLTRIRTGT